MSSQKLLKSGLGHLFMIKTTRCIISEKIFKEGLMNLITGLFTTDNGQKMDSGTAKVHKFGKTARNTSDTGKMIKLMEKEDLYMQMGMCTRVTG